MKATAPAGTLPTNTTYWDMMASKGAAVADSVDWSNVLNPPATYAPSAHTHKFINGDDTRTVNSNPSVYLTGGARAQGDVVFQNEFKQVTTMGLSSFMTGFCIVTTYVPWHDSSGGYPIQVAYGNGLPCWRIGTSATAWGPWTQLIDKPYLADTTAPANKNLIWFDTN
jgi:hypothetical protein